MAPIDDRGGAGPRMPGSPGFWALLFLVVLLLFAYLLSSRAPDSVVLDLWTERCVLLLDEEGGRGIRGFFPVPRYQLASVDSIYWGSGEIRFEGGTTHRGASISMLKGGATTSSRVSVEGPGLAIGNVTWTAGGTLELTGVNVGEVLFRFRPSRPGGWIRGEMSHGDSCRLSMRGYDLSVDGARIAGNEFEEHSALFTSHTHAGTFQDSHEDAETRLTFASDHHEILESFDLSGIRFLDIPDQGTGIRSGSIKIMGAERELSLTRNERIHVETDSLFLNSLIVDPSRKEFHVIAQGFSRSVKMNGRERLPRRLTALHDSWVGHLATGIIGLLGILGGAISLFGWIRTIRRHSLPKEGNDRKPDDSSGGTRPAGPGPEGGPADDLPPEPPEKAV